MRTRSLDKTARAHLAHRPEPDVRAPLLLVAPRAVLRGLAAGRGRLDLLLVVLALEPRQPSGDATMMARASGAMNPETTTRRWRVRRESPRIAWRGASEASELCSPPKQKGNRRFS